MYWPKILRQLSQVFLKVPCPLCQRPASSVVCNDCRRQLDGCKWSDPAARDTHRVTAKASYTSSLSVIPWGRYQGVLKQALALVKYGAQVELGLWLGYQLGQHWKTSTSGSYNPLVVPIPLHTDRLKQRGYNQAALIAQGFCRVTGFPLAEHGLMRTKATTAMYGLGAAARQANVTGAFQLGTGLPPLAKSQSILLIDDIYTTGTTAQAATVSLQQAGYTVVGIATVARAVFLSP